MCYMSKELQRGFTLIELSIVLVIIGLLAGGILVGQELLNAARLHAQVSQIQSYQTAVYTFKLKYNALPGDIKAADAAKLGLASRAGGPGRGNGNKILEDQGRTMGTYVCANEKALFWRDLSQMELIEDSLTTATDSSNTNISTTLPKAKLPDNWVGIWSGGYTGMGSTTGKSNGKNYFVISNASVSGPYYYSQPGMTSSQAFSIDSKIDDGMPHTGHVTAMMPHHSYGIYAVTQYQLSGWGDLPPGTSIAASSARCFDNAGIAANTAKYSVLTAPDANKCALSFEMK